jgi:hypothetical protein
MRINEVDPQAVLIFIVTTYTASEIRPSLGYSLCDRNI